jgi:choline monooxygenase
MSHSAPRRPPIPADLSVDAIVGGYDPDSPLEQASTIPASWYVDPRIDALERRAVFARSWQSAGRLDQVRDPGQYFSCELAGGEPVVIVRGSDNVLRGFFNVCRHHAAAVATEPEGVARHLRCPYHGWTYSLEGALKGTPDFAGVCNFDRDAHGLVPVETAVWEQWVFVRVEAGGPSLAEFLGERLISEVARLRLDALHWTARRRYSLDCNWKVFVDNYLDGGYHVPYLHTGLDSVLDYRGYTIENGARHCLQSSPLVTEGADARTGEVRTGERASYYWIYPNFMINCYAGAMDINTVRPRGTDRTEVVFDFYFPDVSDGARAHNLASIEVSDQIQREDEGICRSVQRGLASGAYTAGRLSVRREAGEHLFHRLLHADLASALAGR